MTTRFTASTALLTVAVLIAGASNIDNTAPNKHAWGENIGWSNWRDANGALDGVNVGPRVLSGFIWCENAGWMHVGDGVGTVPPFAQYANVNGTDYGVNIDSTGLLSGYAWGENIGWIDFGGGAAAGQPARIECSGRLSGFVWSENAGWINLSDPAPTKFVALTPAAVPIGCDVNQDTLIDADDIQRFVNLYFGPYVPSWRERCSADVAAPFGIIDALDVAAFIACLLV